ncbi:hypothetical protein ACOTVS_10135 [Aliarcobacter butzleri]
MEELFKKSEELQKQSIDLEKEYYKNAQKINIEKEIIINKMKELKLNELGISLGDKVIDKKSNEAYIVGVNFRQKPHTYTKNRSEITFDDFEFKGEYRDIKKDGSISKKEPIISLDFCSLKKVENEKGNIQ